MAEHLSDSGPDSIAHIPPLVEKILLGLPSPADLCRAGLVSHTWFNIASSSHVLEEYPSLHNSQPLLGLYTPPALPGEVTLFHAASAALESRALTKFIDWNGVRIPRPVALQQGNRDWIPLHCRGGLLLLAGDERRIVFDAARGRCFDEFIRCPPPPATDTIAECLLQRDSSSSFRVVSVQCDGRRMRAVEYRYSSHSSGEWVEYEWASVIHKLYRHQAMHAGPFLFWRYGMGLALVLDTATMGFCVQSIPYFLPSKFAIGETVDGASCLVGLRGPFHEPCLQIWLLEEENGVLKSLVDSSSQSQESKAWEPPEMELPLNQVDKFHLRDYQRVSGVHTVTRGIVIVYCYRSKQFAIDLKNKRLCGEFECSALGYPLHMPWPPALLMEKTPNDMTKDGEEHNHIAVQETEISKGPDVPVPAMEMSLCLKEHNGGTKRDLHSNSISGSKKRRSTAMEGDPAASEDNTKNSDLVLAINHNVSSRELRLCCSTKQELSAELKKAARELWCFDDLYSKEPVFVCNIDCQHYMRFSTCLTSRIRRCIQRPEGVWLRASIATKPEARWYILLLPKYDEDMATAALTKGWCKFCYDNDINEGDICCFKFSSDLWSVTILSFEAARIQDSGIHCKVEHAASLY